MNKHIITAGHCRINPGLLEEVIRDSPRCTGNKHLLKCQYAGKECLKDCYKTDSYSCPTFKYWANKRE